MNGHQKWLCVIAVNLFSFTAAVADSLRDTVQYTLDTNPDVLISIQQRLQANQQLKHNKAEFYPVADLYGELGRERSKNFSTLQDYLSLTRSDASLSITENLFKGYQTYFNVRADLARISSAAYHVKDTSQNTALAVSEVYLNVLRTKELVAIAERNVQVHRRTFRIIAKRTVKGLSSQSDCAQAEGRYALAQSNLYTEINTAKDATASYIQVVGKPPKNLRIPAEKIPFITASPIQAAQVALKHNPAIKSARYNLYAAIAAHRATYSGDYPSFDLVLRSRRGRNIDGLVGDNFEDTAFLQLSWNLFRGGADLALQKESAYQKEEAFQEIRNAERDTIESTRLAWNELQTALQQLPKLRTHQVKSRFVVDAYTKQYVAGKRTLLDLLNVENEYFSASRAYINGKYNILLAKYRLLNSMGLLLSAFQITPSPPPKVSRPRFKTHYRAHAAQQLRYAPMAVLPPPQGILVKETKTDKPVYSFAPKEELPSPN